MEMNWQYDGAFTFIYSPREGTPASFIKDNVTLDIKNERLQILNAKVNEYSLKNNQKYIGKIVKVLITDRSEKGENMVCGYTETMKLVNLKGTVDDIGKIIDVKILDAKSFSLDGEIVLVNN